MAALDMHQITAYCVISRPQLKQVSCSWRWIPQCVFVNRVKISTFKSFETLKKIFNCVLLEFSDGVSGIMNRKGGRGQLLYYTLMQLHLYGSRNVCHPIPMPCSVSPHPHCFARIPHGLVPWPTPVAQHNKCNSIFTALWLKAVTSVCKSLKLWFSYTPSERSLHLGLSYKTYLWFRGIPVWYKCGSDTQQWITMITKK